MHCSEVDETATGSANFMVPRPGAAPGGVVFGRGVGGFAADASSAARESGFN